MPRPTRIRKIINPPTVKGFKPFGPNVPANNTEPIFLLYEEYEAIRLCDYEMLNHQEASTIMEISRPTLTRIYARARQKLAEAFVNGRQIVFEGGKVYFDSDWYLCNNCLCHFNNPIKTEGLDCCPLCGSENFASYSEKAPANSYGNSKCCEICICPNCGFEREHQIGIPCNKLICPECNIHLKKKRMKIAITSTGNTFTSKLDQRFGRCSWFVFFDTESQGVEFLPNPFKDAEEGSGESSISLLKERKVKKIISGEFGIKVKPMLDSLQIQMIILKDSEKNIQEIINFLNHKKTEK